MTAIATKEQKFKSVSRAKKRGTFKEDNLHARVEHIAIVLNLFRKLVLQLLKQDKTLSDSMAGKRETCAWRFDLALNLLRAAQLPCDARK